MVRVRMICSTTHKYNVKSSTTAVISSSSIKWKVSFCPLLWSSNIFSFYFISFCFFFTSQNNINNTKKNVHIFSFFCTHTPTYQYTYINKEKKNSIYKCFTHIEFFFLIRMKENLTNHNACTIQFSSSSFRSVILYESYLRVHNGFFFVPLLLFF